MGSTTGSDVKEESMVAMNLRPKGVVMKRPGNKAKEPSKAPITPWTEQEMAKLRSIVMPKVQAANGNYHNIDWTLVAKSIPGRTGKQCREKWKNDLRYFSPRPLLVWVTESHGNCTPNLPLNHYLFRHRPDITKEAWSQSEEYILALAHSRVGNK